jgi:hypothetical protein
MEVTMLKGQKQQFMKQQDYKLGDYKVDDTITVGFFWLQYFEIQIIYKCPF